MTFGGDDLYPSLEEKAAALGFSLIQNHPFVDGNKRVGHAAMETFLVLIGYEFTAAVDEAERAILSVAAGTSSREDLLSWIRTHVTRAPGSGAA
jgi:death-on-curing protein